MIDFSITPLGTLRLPHELQADDQGLYVGPGIKPEDIQVYHDGSLVPEAPMFDPVGHSRNGPPVIESSTKIATIVIEGPVTGNGSVGIG